MFRYGNARRDRSHCFAQIRPEIGPFSVAFLGSRRAQVTLARLRLGCSDLAASRARTDRSVSPLCKCGVNETVQHFLLECPLLSPPRRVMFDCVQLALSQISLPSDPFSLLCVILGTSEHRMSRDARLAVVRAVFNFVVASKRRV